MVGCSRAMRISFAIEGCPTWLPPSIVGSIEPVKAWLPFHKPGVTFVTFQPAAAAVLPYKPNAKKSLPGGRCVQSLLAKARRGG